MSQHSKAPLGIKEPKAQKNPYGVSAGVNDGFVRSSYVPPPYYNDLPGFCIGSSGAVNPISNEKK